MKAGDKGRYCDACKKTVHDLSAMTKKEARALLAAPQTEGLCVRYLYDRHGEIAFRDTVPAGSLVRAKRALAAAAVLAVPLSLAACMGAPQRPEPQYQTMGAAPYIPPSAEPDGGAGPVTPTTQPDAGASPIEIEQTPPPPNR